MFEQYFELVWVSLLLFWWKDTTFVTLYPSPGWTAACGAKWQRLACPQFQKRKGLIRKSNFITQKGILSSFPTQEQNAWDECAAFLQPMWKLDFTNVTLGPPCMSRKGSSCVATTTKNLTTVLLTLSSVIQRRYTNADTHNYQYHIKTQVGHEHKQ